MALPVPQHVRCPIVIGRAAQLAALYARLRAVRQGHGRLLLLAGEAGIGKSRLVAEVRARAEAQAMIVLRGGCFEPDRTVPYAPLLAILRAYMGELLSEKMSRHIARIAPDFLDLLPELADYLPPGSPVAAVDAEQARHRRTHAFAQFVLRLAAERPVVLIVEDLHWCDDASLDVLLSLARQIAGRRLLLLCTYRSDEVTPSLAHMLALLDREQLADEIALPRFAPQESEAMLGAIFAQAPPLRGDFLHAIHDLTDGNPFFIEEVLRSLIATDDIVQTGGHWEWRSLGPLRIPRSVQDAVTRRTRDLSPDASGVLRLAAIAGRSFDFAILQDLTGLDEQALLAAMRELVEAQLVVEESAERFAFRHALTRQAIDAAMLARERRSLHSAVAEAIERLHGAMPEPYLADLSYHFAAGEAWEKALVYGERAGSRALALYAPRAAVEHFTRAIAAAAQLSRTPSVDLYRQRGQALALLGEFDRALTDYQAVLARAQGDDDQLAEWRALLDLGGLWSGYDYARAGEYFERALARARALDNPQAVAESLMQFGGWYLNTERTDEAEEALQAALAIFERVGDAHGTAQAVDLLGMVGNIAGDLIRMRRWYERAAQLFRELDNRQGLCSVLTTMLGYDGAYHIETVVIPPGIPAEQTERAAAEAIALTRAIDWRAGEACALLAEAVCLGPRGIMGRALERAREGFAVAREIDHREWMASGEWAQGIIYAELLALEQAAEHLGSAYALARESGSLNWLHLTTSYLAEIHIMQGERDEARDLLMGVAPALPMRTQGQRRIWTARAKQALADGDAAHALAIVDGLFGDVANCTEERDIPLLALLRGEAFAMLDRDDEAEASLSAALRGAAERGLRARRWRSHLALGQLSTKRGRAAEAHTQYRAAWEIVGEVAATLPVGALQRTFLTRTAALIPTEQTRTVARNGSALTSREWEVASLVAQGCSNRDIADRLAIGERTVETHVGNILSKLAFGSRAQIAAWAVESGVRRAAE